MNITFMNKALVAILPSILIFLNQKFGFHFDVTPETLTAISGFITAILVYFVPNKDATA